jgi:hypothetical protein
MTSTGQACERVSLSSSVTICEQASAGLKTCKVDTDCPGNNEVCCTIYNTGLCTAANECPKACAPNNSSACNTQAGEVCCTTANKVDPSVTAPGLCLNPQYAPCPKPCATDSQCASTNQLCCNGICSATCPKACNVSSDCDQQICCTSYKASLPPGPVLFHTGPTCSGTPTYATCQQCGQLRGCAYCPGCGIDGGAGICQGTPYSSTCSYCGTYYNCTCPGCTAGAQSCSGTPLACNNWFDQISCVAAGCTWPDGGTACTGLPNPCATFNTQSTCQTQGCTWSVSCTGTPTLCGQLTTSTTCGQQPGCTFYTGTGPCDGTPTPCSQLTPAQCSTEPGCILTQ